MTRTVYRVTLRRTRHVNVIRPAGQLRSYNLYSSRTLDEVREFVQRTDCDSRPWEIERIEPRS